MSSASPRTQRLIDLDHAHLWHPFTPMRQWRQSAPLIIERGEGDWLVDTEGRRYLDGVSSLWCNVHGHHVEKLDQAIRDQLDRIAHTTMLGLANVPAIELAGRLCALAPAGLDKVFYSDAGATAAEVAFKMAVGYWYHRGQPQRHLLVGLEGAYHGDTTGSMSVGYSDLFHRPFQRMVFQTRFIPAPDVRAHQRDHGGAQRTWSLEDAAACAAARDHALAGLERTLSELGDRVAAVVVEPLVQGAAGMVMQPPGYLRGAAELARKHGTLLIADEVATGFGRTGRMFACEHEGVAPDILCLAKGITGGYLPLAATLCTDEIEQAFTGEIADHRTLYHGHTYTGNPLACAAALASLDLFEEHRLIEQVQRKAELLARALDPLRDRERFPHVLDVRQRGLMVGIELNPSPTPAPAPGSPGTPGSPRTPEHPGHPGSPASPADKGFDPSRRIGHEVCAACRPKGLIIRPLGHVVVLMPPLAMEDANLQRMAAIVIETIAELHD